MLIASFVIILFYLINTFQLHENVEYGRINDKSSLVSLYVKQIFLMITLMLYTVIFPDAMKFIFLLDTIILFGIWSFTQEKLFFCLPIHNLLLFIFIALIIISKSILRVDMFYSKLGDLKE